MSVANRAFLEYQVAQLKQAGAEEIVFATNYMADRIEAHFGDGSRFGVRMRYALEHEPLGTAGAIRNAVEGLPPMRAIVFNGDILTDFDIAEIARQHLQREAQVTLTLYRVARPHPYGVIQVDESGRVLAFLEPTEEQKRAADRGTPTEGSDFINAGIYIMEPEILERIPLRPCSIEREFYPQILQEGARVYGAEGKGFWLDIGRPAQYLRATRALLSGEVKTALPPGGHRTEQGYWLDGYAEIAPDAEIEAGCLIGANACVESRVKISGYTVIGTNSTIGSGSTLHGCVLGAQVQVGDGCHLVDCILDDEVVVEPHVRMRGAILGAGSLLRAYSSIETNKQGG